MEDGAAHRAGRSAQERPVAPSPAGGPIRHLPGHEPTYALTFDDGPDPDFTPRILALLADHGVPATFFVLGEQCVSHPDVVAALRDAGMGIGVHSWDHCDLRGSGPGLVRDQLGRTIDLLHRLGADPVLFRPPFGNWDDDVVGVAAELGLQTVCWSVDSRDWQEPPEDRLVARVGAALRPGSIVLMHDGGGDRAATVAALPRLIQHAADAGLACVELAEALRCRPERC